MRIARSFISLAAVLVLSMLPSTPGGTASASLHPHDGPAACTAGAPAAGYRGYCGTYGGYNTWYGSYGPGFPNQLGWVFCANDPSHPGKYPSPTYSYTPSGPPAGASTTQTPQLGFAISEAEARGWMRNGVAGSFSADQAHVATQFLVRRTLWNVAPPTMDAALQRAWIAITGLFNQAAGASGTPVLGLGLQGGGSTFATTATITGSLTFPGSAKPLVGTSVTLGVTGATFTSATGPTSLTLTTSSAGTFTATLVNTTAAAHPVTVTARSQVGQLGVSFYRPTQYVTDAQVVVGTASPTARAQSLFLNTTALEGQIAISKAVDDPGYYGPEGAQFQVLDGTGQVLTTLTTDEQGAAGPTEPLPIGTYTVHEVEPPEGYQPSPDQSVTVTAGQTTTVSYSGSTIERAITASLSLRKVDATSGVGLGGAVLELAFDPTNAGTYTEVIGTCTTATDGTCEVPGQSTLLPGNYEVTELEAPPGYLVADPATTKVTLIPGEVATVHFADHPALTSLGVAKFNASSPTTAVPGAVYDLYAVDPAPPSGPSGPTPPDAAVVAQMTWWDRGTTDAEGQLRFTIPVGYRWCVKEHRAPAGFDVDPGLHCTATVRSTARNVELTDATELANLEVFKYNASSPGTGIPGATYDLFVRGDFPAGYPPVPEPAGVVVPGGTAYFDTKTTDATGHLEFSLPSGYAWCVQERTAPAGYALDPGLHCTDVLTSTSPPSATTVAVPERPELPFTGAPDPRWWWLGLALVVVGAGLLLLDRARRPVH